MVVYVVMAIIAYAIGSISFAVIISRKMAGFDVRDTGSKGAGTTNVLRSVGKKAALLTLLCDALKGVIAVLIALLLGLLVKNSNKAILVEVAAFAVVVGHTFPIFFEFRGGKGVATSLGIILLLNWKIGLICLVFALILILITRMVSLGSICASILFAVLTIFIRDSYITEFEYSYIVFAILMAAFVIFNHRKNLKRIIDGNENKIDFSKKTESEKDEVN